MDDELHHLRSRLAVLERQVAAKDRTILVLMDHAEAQASRGTSASTVLEQNIALEQIVARKTHELDGERAHLAHVNEELNRQMEERSRIEIELRHAQRLESVGRLAAGVAHEINTPVQFVSDSIQFVKESVSDMITLLIHYRELRETVSQGMAGVEPADRISTLERELDIDYAITELPGAIERSIDGLTRIANLVGAMKEFAHAEDREMAVADLNRAVSSTLTIAQHEVRHIADLEIGLEDLPPVSCHVAELNQVVLHLVVNAAHAIEDRLGAGGGKGRITVTTRLDGDHVVIAVADTGAGIPADVRDSVFDPFFTTKEVGRGTGQGLTIARSIVVDKHQGKLWFETEVGAGTTFFVRIPIDTAPAPLPELPPPPVSAAR